MKNKIIIGVVAIVIAAGVIVFAKNKQVNSGNCPNTPGCICHPAG